MGHICANTLTVKSFQYYECENPVVHIWHALYIIVIITLIIIVRKLQKLTTKVPILHSAMT